MNTSEALSTAGENYYETSHLWSVSRVPARHVKNVSICKSTTDPCWSYGASTTPSCSRPWTPRIGLRRTAWPPCWSTSGPTMRPL